MASSFKWNPCLRLNLSQACSILGWVDLISSIFIIVECSILFHNNHATENIYFIVAAIISICTCLPMMSGSAKKNHWLLIPHIIWKILLIEYLAVLIVMFIWDLIASGEIIAALVPIAVATILLFMSILYWKVTFHRYLEIKGNEFNLPESIEMM